MSITIFSIVSSHTNKVLGVSKWVDSLSFSLRPLVANLSGSLKIAFVFCLADYVICRGKLRVGFSDHERLLLSSSYTGRVPELHG